MHRYSAVSQLGINESEKKLEIKGWHVMISRILCFWVLRHRSVQEESPNPKKTSKKKPKFKPKCGISPMPAVEQKAKFACLNTVKCHTDGVSDQGQRPSAFPGLGQRRRRRLAGRAAATVGLRQAARP